MSRKWSGTMKEQWVTEVTEVKCNVCHTVFEVGKDDAKIENCIQIVKSFGYHSEHFGDGTDVNIDICEACAHKMFGHNSDAVHEWASYKVFYEEGEEEDLTFETADGTITFRR